MEWTTDPVTQVLEKLRSSDALQGVDFCRAYPDQMKPSRLLRPVVAVRLAEIQSASDAVGEESQAGQIALCFDLYAPPAAGTRALQQALSGICRTLLDRRVCAVSAGAPGADTDTGCLHLRATLTYREDIEDGDGEYERTGQCLY